MTFEEFAGKTKDLGSISFGDMEFHSLPIDFVLDTSDEERLDEKWPKENPYLKREV